MSDIKEGAQTLNLSHPNIHGARCAQTLHLSHPNIDGLRAHRPYTSRTLTSKGSVYLQLPGKVGWFTGQKGGVVELVDRVTVVRM